MAKYPPFVNATGNVTKVLDRIKQAPTPQRFTQDYLATVLKLPGGSAKPVIPLLKRIGFLATDGTPTDRYKRFRNPDSSGAAMAEAIKDGFPELYKANEYAHQLDRNKLKNLVVETTGLDPSAPTVNAIVGSFEALKKHAKFDGVSEDTVDVEPAVEFNSAASPAIRASAHSTGIGISFQINLVMPNTDDPAVFAAMFKALKEHLLS